MYGEFNKRNKGQISATLIWIVAIFAIFLFMIIFWVLSGMIAKQKDISVDIRDEKQVSSLVLPQGKVQFKGGYYSGYDLIRMWSTAKSIDERYAIENTIRKMAEKYFKNCEYAHLIIEKELEAVAEREFVGKGVLEEEKKLVNDFFIIKNELQGDGFFYSKGREVMKIDSEKLEDIL